MPVSQSTNPKQQSGSSPGSGSDTGGKESFQISAPSISLPKGGGAIRGMGEKFAANPVTGTGSMTVPIATSPGRSGFGPQLSLSYDSGAGNGPFGFGWSLSLPSITRKTDKGLPKYQDAEESDVFILSGAEDLVPVLSERSEALGQREKLDSTTNRRQSETYTYPPLSPPDRRALRAHRALDEHKQTRRMSSGARSPKTTSRPGTAKTENSRIADPRSNSHLQLADLPEPR